MKININYPQLAAEFVIVFVGVAVALAADGWRQGLQDRSIENDYLERITIEMEDGYSVMEGVRERTADALAATSLLVGLLESEVVDKITLTDNFLLASRLGFSRNNQLHDVAYRELVSTAPGCRNRLWPCQAVHDWLEQFTITVSDPAAHDMEPRRRGRPTKQEARARR